MSNKRVNKGFYKNTKIKTVIKRRKKSSKTSSNKIVDPCDRCGLYKTCKSPKMQYTGEGKKNILIIGEAQGRTEDEDWSDMGYDEPTQLIGQAGKLLRRKCKEYDIDIDRDCWKINALLCRPPKNKKPTRKQLDCCKPNILKAIEELKPKFIWLLGGAAVESFYMGRFKNLQITRWRNLCIPDKKSGAWVLPMFHPSYLLRNEKDKNLESTYDRDLKFAVDQLNRDYPTFENYEHEIERLTDFDEVVKFLRGIIRNKPIIFPDYETTGLKPYRPKGEKPHRILVIGINKVSFPYDQGWWDKEEFNVIKKLLIRIMTDPEIKKVAQNLKFEEIWTREIIGVAVAGWIWCTMNASHIIDSRKYFTGLKFQAYIRYGIEGYDRKIKRFIKGYPFNNLDKVPLLDLLMYVGMDTLVTEMLYYDQVKELKEFGDRRHEANKLFTKGLMAFANSQEIGIHADKEYYESKQGELKDKLESIEAKILNGKEARKFKEHTGRDLTIAKDISTKDLRILLFDVMECDSQKKTATGLKSVDHESLVSIDTPFTKRILERRTLFKIKNTYINQFLREITDNKIHPFLNLHMARSYRSSSSNPNFQNVPTRNEYAKEICRSGIKPSSGNKLGGIDYCLTGNTLIETIDGIRRLDNIAKECSKQDIYVYCYKFDKGRVGVSKVVGGKKTRRNVPVYKVTLDNDKTVLATSDHKFILRNGNLKQLSDLSVGDSLMPFYKKRKKSRWGTNYDEVYLNNGKRMLAHNLIVLDIYGIKIRGSNLVVHHKDGNGTNNSLYNIPVVTRNKHMKIHSLQGWERTGKVCRISKKRRSEIAKILSKKKKRYWNSLPDWEKKEFGRRISEGIEKAGGRAGSKNGMFGRKQSEETKKKISIIKKKQNIKSFLGRKHTGKTKRKISEANKGKQAWNKGKRLLPIPQEQKDKISKTMKGRIFSDVHKERLKAGCKKRWDNTEPNKYCKICGKHFGKTFPPAHFKYKHNLSVKEYKKQYENKGKDLNHTVKTIEFWGYSDTYNITVENDHNFALDAGVMVMNSSMEVRISACFTKDPALIAYIEDPSTDMHRDSAQDLFMLNDKQITDKIRFYAKNQFVFPEFYGSWYKACAASLAENCFDLKTAEGKPVEEHLVDQGMKKYDDFEDHVKDVEKKFWEKFHVYAEWKEKVIEEYQRNGYVEMFFGHKRGGYLTNNMILNSGIQGTAFHCLLWSYIELDEILMDYKTKLVSQIHDEVIPDIYPPEEKQVLEMAKDIMCNKIRKKHEWIIVPLEVDIKLSEVDGNWYEMKKIV